ncbi:MAG: hypothetical protein AAB571_11665 [Chloroflexota bacterium]
MDFVKIFQSIEDVIYEIATWIVFVPKTLLFVLLRPQWTQPYVTSEWAKEAKQRFKEFMSPPLFWVIVAIVPNILLYTLLPDAKDVYSSLSFADRFFALATFLVGVPAFFAATLQQIKEHGVEKDSLKRFFYIQCLVCAPAQLGLVMYDRLTARAASDAAPYFLMLIGLWLVGMETVIFKQELNTSWWKALGLALLSALACFAVLIILVIILAVVLLKL